jgi:serine/threonine protein kinase
MPTTVTCPGCGGFVPLGDRFCGACGTPISGSALMSGEGARFDPWEELLQKLRQATIGEYEIKGELGRGGMAAVLLAHDLQLNRKVAIKVMLPGLVYGASMWDRFLSEARTAAKLDHPNIIYIHSVKEKDRFLYFVMKYIDGRSLDDILAQPERLPVPVAQTILVEVARALDYAHHEGVVHRDIKPANIMIDQKGNAIVMDFGIARATDEKRFTQTGATIGTPAYMSPEQCRGNETTAASDQYSLGILAYEMLAGSPPFAGTPIELQIAHMQDAPRSLRDIRPEISLELSGAVMRMLAKDPAERWPSLQQLVPIFGRGLDAHDDGPRNYLVGLVRAGSPRRRSFPATPVSPHPVGANGAALASSAPTTAPVSGEGTDVPSSVTTPVNALALPPLAKLGTTGGTPTPVSMPAVPAAASAAGPPASADAADTSGVMPVLPLAEFGDTSDMAVPRDDDSFISAPRFTPADEAFINASRAMAPVKFDNPPSEEIAPATPGQPRRLLWMGVGGVAVIGVVWAIVSRGSKPPPPPEPVAPPPAPVVTAATAVENAIGDSVVVGHGADATALVNGKTPRPVTPDAISILLIKIAKQRVFAGDTVRVRLEVLDDAGLPVTTNQIVWSTSNPRIAHFFAPGQLVAVGEGKATITVSAGTASATHDIRIDAAKAAPTKNAAPKRDGSAKAVNPPKRDSSTKAAAPSRRDSTAKAPPGKAPLAG